MIGPLADDAHLDRELRSPARLPEHEHTCTRFVLHGIHRRAENRPRGRGTGVTPLRAMARLLA
jgi:hypothetical protein